MSARDILAWIESIPIFVMPKPLTNDANRIWSYYSSLGPYPTALTHFNHHQLQATGNMPPAMSDANTNNQVVPTNYRHNYLAYAQNAHGPSAAAPAAEMQPIKPDDTDLSQNNHRTFGSVYAADHPYARYAPAEPSSSTDYKRKSGRTRSTSDATRPVSTNNASSGRVAKSGHQRTNSRQSAGTPSAKQREMENLQIAELRVKHLWEWPQIVDFMNDQRVKNHQDPSFTDAAVYGRFKRNGPALFVKHGYGTFDPSCYMHLKHLKARMDQDHRSGPAGTYQGNSSTPIFVSSHSNSDNADTEQSSDAEGEPDDEYVPRPSSSRSGIQAKTASPKTRSEDDHIAKVVSQTVQGLVHSHQGPREEFWPVVAQQASSNLGGRVITPDIAKAIWVSLTSSIPTQ